MSRSPIEAARIALACMDLTSLGDRDSAAIVGHLVARSQGPSGAPAALCVWPRFVSQVRGGLRALHIDGVAARPKVAAVANFPSGAHPLQAVLTEVRGIVADGADEVDLVLDWRALQRGDAPAVEQAARGVRAVRQACGGLSLKLIIESGELQDPALIDLACRIGLNEGVDFLKTSTGKTPTGATPQAARVMLQAIAAHPRGRRVGFKASGGVRTVRDAQVYIDLVTDVLGPDALVPARFRIGASALLDDVESVLQSAGGGDQRGGDERGGDGSGCADGDGSGGGGGGE